jgi:pyrroline-5-carboxylate reductase
MASLAVAGFGKLGSSIVRGAIDAGVVAAGDIVVWARSETRQAQADAWGLQRADWPSITCRADRLLLALKPQAFTAMTAERPPLQRGVAVLSVMGGWRSADIGGRLGTDRVIRAMPTVAASVGASVTALAIDERTPAEDARFARSLFEAVGRVVTLPEAMFDAATAVGASGVGFACLFLEALEHAATGMGMDATAARELAIGALDGAARCLRSESVTPHELRQRVTSPGGTTAAGVQSLESGGLADLVRRAIEAATARAAELGRGGR